jgi:hypothetical protein
VKISDLEKKFKNNDIINKETLIKAGLLNRKKANNRVKILGASAGKSKFNISEELLFSQSAKKSFDKISGEAKSKAAKK